MTYRGTGTGEGIAMRRSMGWRGCRALLVCVCLSFASNAFAERNAGAAAPADSSRPAHELVQAALRTELGGLTDARAELLNQALARDPNFAPARWHLGLVRIDNEWLNVDEVARRAASDEHLAAYRKMRDALVDTADNHRALAVWCRKHKLPAEERVHWAKVLEFEPSDAEAIAGLGLQLYQGRLLTRAQIESEKKMAGERARAMQHWKPKVLKWRAALEGGKSAARDDAWRQLKEISDPAAIPALESVLAVGGMSPKSVELNVQLIETVGRMKGSAATQVLLRRALFSESAEVCGAAVEQLRLRPMHTYAPQLIAALPGRIKTAFRIYTMPNGCVMHEHEVLLEGRQADVTLYHESFFSPADTAAAVRATPSVFHRETRSAAAIEAKAGASATQLDEWRRRVQFVLEQTTGFSSGDDPGLWQKQYDSYNGWETPETTKPEYTVRGSESQMETSPPINTYTTIRPHNCFPVGTPVLTILGPRPIEQIKIGDRVLSQDVDSGELVYKPVESTTVRKSTPMLKIVCGHGAITATEGHPFWVAGRGWITAKHLSVDMPLCAVGGAVAVSAIEPQAATEAYNLVVSELHDYFVGDAAVLVHDNSPLLETRAIIPGFVVRD